MTNQQYIDRHLELTIFPDVELSAGVSGQGASGTPLDSTHARLTGPRSPTLQRMIDGIAFFVGDDVVNSYTNHF